ncbi:MAG: FG-GAP-like repeat-containing protein [Pyrinomonadaceae bacterium]
MRVLLTIVAILVFTSASAAAVRTWDGGGADANWQTAANWVGDVAPAANDDLVFPAAAAQFATNNNFFFLTTFRSITVEGGTYTFGGNPIRLTAGLNVAAGTSTFNLAITLSAAQTFTTGQGAAATLVVLSVGSFPLAIDGAGTTGIGLISGTGAITKLGPGAAAIVAASSFSGPITLNDGIFVVDANIPSSSVTVNGTAPTSFALSGFGGTGTVGAVSVVQGVVSAGTLTSPTGILNISNGLTLSPNGAYVCKIGGTAPGANGHDQLNVTGAVNLGGSRLAPLPWANFRPAVGSQFVIIRNDGTDAVSGTFAGAPEGSVFAGPLNTAFRITYAGGDGNDVAIQRVARAQFDFDGDGKSDLSSFSNQGWYIERSSDSQLQLVAFGLPTDVIVPADYDGDNRTDVAVFRPSTGDWYILNSATSTTRILQFGANGDIPVPNDFDGDGRADIAIFRPSGGEWWQLRSLSGQVYAQQFGRSGDKPLMMDFDGDGIGDIAVYRPSEGAWYVFQSGTNSYLAFPFGVSTDVAVPADYDGDGRTDPAVFRATADPAQPDFFVLRSSDQTVSYASWGVPGDRPVVADYDGDGRADIAVERASFGNYSGWYILQSSAGYRGGTQWTGIAPVPGAFYR